LDVLKMQDSCNGNANIGNHLSHMEVTKFGSLLELFH
jgi:hypothetical protein